MEPTEHAEPTPSTAPSAPDDAARRPARDLTEDLRLAHMLADNVDSLTMARFKAQDLEVSTKPDLTPVTDADRAAEESIRATLSRARARDLILGEEFGGELARSGRQWVVDPIDGTKNFVRGVRSLDHVDSEARRLGGQRGEPVGLVPAQVPDPAQPRRPRGQQCQRGHGGRELGGVRHVPGAAHPGSAGAVDAAADRERAARGVAGGGGEGHVRAEGGQDRAPAVPDLRGRRGPVRHGHLAAGHRGRRQEGPGVGQVRLHVRLEGRHRPRVHPPHAGGGLVHPHPVPAQERHGHGHVLRARDALARVADGEPVRASGGGEQEAGEELGGTRGVHGGLVPERGAGRQPHRQAAGLAEVLHARARLLQARQQRPHRPDPRRRVPVHHHDAGPQRRQGRHEPHHGPREAAVHADLARQRRAHGQGGHHQGSVHAVLAPGAERLEGPAHQRGVPRGQGAVQHARPVRHSGEHEEPVRQGLRAGQPHGPPDRPEGRGRGPRVGGHGPGGGGRRRRGGAGRGHPPSLPRSAGAAAGNTRSDAGAVTRAGANPRRRPRRPPGRAAHCRAEEANRP